ncbi:MAG: hypothetical protein WCI27_11375 [Candidatus Omnitrophota bacterium]
MKRIDVSDTPIAWSINDKSRRRGIVSIRNTTGNDDQRIRTWPGGTVNSRVSVCDGIVKTISLKKARSLFKDGFLGHNRGQLKRMENHQARLPTGQLYDLSGALK